MVIQEQEKPDLTPEILVVNMRLGMINGNLSTSITDVGETVFF